MKLEAILGQISINIDGIKERKKEERNMKIENGREKERRHVYKKLKRE